MNKRSHVDLRCNEDYNDIVQEKHVRFAEEEEEKEEYFIFEPLNIESMIYEIEREEMSKWYLLEI